MTAPFSVGGVDHKHVESENESSLDNAWSEDHECLPLKQRLKLLRAKAVSECREEVMISALSPTDDIVCDSMDFYSDDDRSEEWSDNASCEQSQHGTEILENEYTEAQDDSVIQFSNFQHSSSADDIEEFLDDLDHVVLKERQRMLLSRDVVECLEPAMEHNLSDLPANLVHMTTQNGGIGSDIKSSIGGNDVFELCEENEAMPCSSGKSVINKKHFFSSSSNCVVTLALAAFQNVKVEPLEDELQIPKTDDTDRPCLGNQVPVKRKNVNNAESLEDIIDHTFLGDRMRSDASRKFSNTSRVFLSFGNDHSKSTLSESSKPLLIKQPCKRRKTVTDVVGSTEPAMEHNLSDPSTSFVPITVQNAGIASDNHGIQSSMDGNEVLEKCDGNEGMPCSSAPPAFQNVKVEPLEDDDLQLPIPKRDDIDSACLGNQVSVKSENENNAEIYEEIIDHMFLGDRMRLLASRKFSKYDNFETPRAFSSSGNDFAPLYESSKPLQVKRPRKRRRTVTDSIETALEEDAPGLLQVLIKKGVLVDEIKLYGENEGDEALDDSLIEESFSELEDVITKIFSQRQSLLKLAPIRCAKGERASYCLACLISLVEQARYLRFRKWPVEWGWCRDLQSFIFVFERHNRIVLERPEYGYATYFFELVDTLPVNWQVKRLVTAMKLTSCSRITLIENRPLTVGGDMTEGEARVLMEYGWIPDTGLATMVNYCDRVVHDRKYDESDSSEWRSKIGKILTDGYNGGVLVPNDIPKKLTEYCASFDYSQIKLEQ